LSSAARVPTEFSACSALSVSLPLPLPLPLSFSLSLSLSPSLSLSHYLSLSRSPALSLSLSLSILYMHREDNSFGLLAVLAKNGVLWGARGKKECKIMVSAWQQWRSRMHMCFLALGGNADFVSGTCSVIWPVAAFMARPPSDTTYVSRRKTHRGIHIFLHRTHTLAFCCFS